MKLQKGEASYRTKRPIIYLRSVELRVGKIWYRLQGLDSCQQLYQSSEHPAYYIYYPDMKVIRFIPTPSRGYEVRVTAAQEVYF